MLEYDIFIAYSGPDQDQAEELYDELTATSGLHVFFDKQSLKPGEVFGTAIPRALVSSQIVVALISEHWDDAHFVKDEVYRAIGAARSNPEPFPRSISSKASAP